MVTQTALSYAVRPKAWKRGPAVLPLLLYVYAFHAGLGIEFPIANFVGNFGIGDLALLCALMLLAVSNRTFRIAPVSLFPVALGIISALSWALSPLHGWDNFRPDAWGFVVRWLSYAALLVIVPAIVVNQERLRWCLRWLTIGVLTQLLLAWLLWRLDPRFQFFGLPWLGSATFNANTLGFYLAVSVPLLFAFLVQSRSWLVRSSMLALMAIVLVSAFFTSSKGAWATITVILGISIIVSVFSRSRAGNGAVLALILAAGILTSYIYTGDTVLELVQQRWAASAGSNLQRLEMIEAATEMAADHPLFGAGPKSYDSIGYLYARHESDPHNVYVWLAAEIGLLGLSMYLLVLIVALPYYWLRLRRIERRSGSQQRFVFLGIVIAVVLMSFVTGLPASDKVFWLTLSLLVAAQRIPADDKPPNINRQPASQ